MTINTNEQIERIMALRKRLFDLIRAVDMGHHKSYEGALDISISLPGIFELEDDTTSKIELGCYLLCYGRGETFRGKSIKECIDQFEAWIKDKEMSVFCETREWKYNNPDFSKHEGNAIDYTN